MSVELFSLPLTTGLCTPYLVAELECYTDRSVAREGIISFVLLVQSICSSDAFIQALNYRARTANQSCASIDSHIR